MKIETKLHTVFMTVGPSMCGKSTFSRAFKFAIDKKLRSANLGATSQAVILSSDEERQNILPYPSLHRYAPLMMEASEQAFNVLMTKLRAHVTYPTNTEFVVVDTTGMNDIFRKQVKKIAEDNGYRTELITFEYVNSNYWSQSTEDEKRVVQKSVNRFKREVLPNLGRKEHDGLIRIKSRSETKWTDLEVEIENLDTYARTQKILSSGANLNVIGDIHEHIEGFSDLLAKLELSGFNVLIGDYIDKGNDLRGILKAVRAFVDNGGYLVHGNHESYAVKRIKGLIKNPDLELEKKYMESVSILLENKDLADELVDLYDNHSVPFLKFVGPGTRTIYITHAPCENKHLGKMSSEALKAQRNLYGDRGEDYRKAYEFIFKEAVGNHPLHLFGHVAHGAQKLEYKNKIFLDTGAVYGGRLTSFVYKKDRYEFVSVQTKEKVTISKPLDTNLTTPIQEGKKPFSIYDYRLDTDDYKFLNRALKNEIQYISGTMAPAPSTGTEIESLSAGLKYFQDKGASRVILQPKYMGSRCQMYLFRGNLEKCFLVSRNGYKIHITENLQEMIKTELKNYEELHPEFWNESLILDGELLPWATLGESLISEQFEAYEELVRYELETLANDEAYAALDFRPKIDAKHLLENDLKTFSETLKVYSTRCKPQFKPFSILKIDNDTMGTKFDVADSFDIVSTDACEIIDFSAEDAYSKAKSFFDSKTVDEKMEGIVIKPLDGPEDIAPYMKVRNENYLTLVYGYDYKRKYGILCAEKKISGKLRTSIIEHDLATKMLGAENNQELTECIVKMIFELNHEKTLDPRL